MAMFGRFLDSWVVDRVMFEYVSQGGCNCCGFTHGGMDMMDFMALCSDVETDDGRTEKKSPWPQFMQDEVWADRVKLRRMLKDTMSKYRELHEMHGPDFVQWWMELEPRERKRCFQMPKEELRVMFNTIYDFKSAYQVVLCSVLEQVENFPQTGYKADGGSDCEIFLEEHLVATRGAWTVKEEYYNTDDGCDMFFGMLMQLGGDHLLPKRSTELRREGNKAKRRVEADGDDIEDGGGREVDDPDESEKKDPQGGSSQSFRGDRRLVRILIFRYFADMVWARFKRAHAAKAQDQQATRQVEDVEVDKQEAVSE
mmetsp:Transcript_3106/g.9244  ORF Transcript_3106/g.9244 Transcript_3106/m.9244 type:complete len:312 (-) Transcript_3106:198-1133(-)